MILVDSNVPMYLIGAEHPNKRRAVALLEELIRGRKKLIADAETFQEICHRYQSIDRLEAINPAYDVLLGIVDKVVPVTEQDVLLSKNILLENHATSSKKKQIKLSARDTLHLAVMKNLGIDQILTFDTDFDAVPWVKRLC